MEIEPDNKEEAVLADNISEIEVEIKNAEGLHMRPAFLFVDIASKYKKCNISVSNGDITVDAKSIMQVAMLAATHGSKLKIVAEGQDCQQATEELRELVEDKLFGDSAG